MAWDLMVDVLDHAPDMSAAEKLVLQAIAERMRAYDRTKRIDSETLMRRAMLTESGLRKALAKLRARGIDVRVPMREDSRGMPLYAVRGRAGTYVLRKEWFAPPADCGCEACEKTSTREGGISVPPTNDGGTEGPGSGTEGPGSGTEGPGSGTEGPPLPYVSPEGRETYVPASPARSPSGTRVPPSAKKPHSYDDSGLGMCACGLLERNKIHQRRAA